ncbi:MAG: glycosyltransferase family 39 protein [Desulfatibacillum sp.]|nr:glycosyltransferase family 39 protein [Desulfatibacillum sp.]
MTNPRNLACYSILFAIALAIRIFFFFNHGVAEVFGKYPHFAWQLAQGHDLGERLLDLSPVYLHAMAFAARMGFTVGSLEAAQLFLGAVNTLLIFAIGSRLMGRLAAFLGGLAYACHGNIMALESTFEPLVLLLFLSLACILFLVMAQEAHNNFKLRLWFVAASALFAGLAVITKPNFGLFCLGTVCWFLISFDHDLNLGKKLALALLFCTLAGMVILPVTARNYLKFNDFILVSDSYGRLFYNGNEGQATGFFPQNLEGQDNVPEGVTDPDHSHVFFRERASLITGRDLKPSQSARFWFQAGVQDLRAAPVRAVALWGQKLALFFHGYENHLIDSAYWKYQWTSDKPFLTFRWIAALALLGVFLNFRRVGRLFPLYCLLFAFLVSCLVFMANSRYRAPALPALCLFAGSALACMKEWVADRNWKKIGAGLLVMALFSVGDSMLFRDPAAAHDRAFQPELRRQYHGDQPICHSSG